MRIYRDAIANDSVTLWRGTPFPRLSGMIWAAADGAGGLRVLIVAKHPLLSREDQLRFPLLRLEIEPT